MTILSTPPPPNLFLLPLVPSSGSATFVTPTLRPDQLVRATVIAGDAAEPLLELGKERFRALSGRALQPGQVLDLRIVQVAPRLEALVLNNHLQERLAARLPSLSQPFDWFALLERLQQPQMAQQLQFADVEIVRQLQQLLAPAGGRFVSLREGIVQLVDQLRLLGLAGEGAPRPSPVPFPAVRSAENLPPVAVSLEQSRLSVQLLGRLQAQLVPLVEQGGERMATDWQRATAELLVQVRQGLAGNSFPALRSPEWTQALQLLRQHPGVTAQISTEAGKILVQLAQVAAAVGAGRLGTPLPQPMPPAAAQLNLPVDMAASERFLPVQQKVHEAVQRVAADVKALLGAGVDAPRSPQFVVAPLTPELLGRIEGLTERFYLLLTKEGLTPILQQSIQALTVQLQQLATVSRAPARGESLGLLSQFFGLHLERELLLGKQKQALANLKQSLLKLQQKTGEDFKEPLQRIEIFQLCKARFAETQLQFMPLPFVGLEHGYLLADRHAADRDETVAEKTSAGQTRLSLSLRLSALGNMRVDLQYDPDLGLVVQVACEDRGKMEYLKGCGDELKACLRDVKLQQVHYSADAQHPLKQLQQRLLPQQQTLLDTRA